MWKGALYLGLSPPLFFLPLPPLIIWFSSGSSENAACTWQMCGTTAAAYRSVSPLLIQACFLCHKWKFNMRLKTDWEFNQQRQSVALTASEQLLMQKIIIKKMSEWYSVCCNYSSIWPFVLCSWNTHLIRIILLPTKQQQQKSPDKFLHYILSKQNELAQAGYCATARSRLDLCQVL